MALVGLLTVLFLGTGAPYALAHDALVASSPAAGSAVPTAPSAVELGLSGTPLPLGTEVLVRGPDGEPVSTGAAEIRGTTVVQTLAAGLPAGGYTVQWRSTSSDGHPLTGSWAFAVTTGSTPAPDQTATRAAGTALPGDGLLDGALVLGGVLGLGAVAVLVVGGLRGRP